jgi:hypothetical protein
MLTLALGWFALSQPALAQDGDEGRSNTAEGAGALHTYITTASSATDNTAIGFDALFSDTTGNGNTATGQDALFKNTTGGFNTATGIAALQNNTTASDNTADGTFALTNNTTGNDNTATGSAALSSNTTGSNNTANGFNALSLNTNGSDNTAMGYRALLENGFDAIDNTGIGSGALSSNVSGGFNTAIGFNALFNNTASSNTAIGDQTLLSNTTGTQNTGTGAGALFKNTSGNNNSADGSGALFSNTTGSNNTADGPLALENNTIGHDNSAEGFQALANNTSGSSNIALGSNAGINLTTGSNNIDIGARGVAAEANTIRIGTSGTQQKTFIAGISGKTVASGVGVIINSSGQLGTIQSSARFKTAIQPMNKASETILALKPVTFRYKEELDPDGVPQFGLIAEEVERVNPDLVVRDEDGKVSTVRYEAVNAMLLNEFLKEHGKVEEQGVTIAQMKKQIEALTATMQKVSDELELNRRAPQLVANGQ